MIVLCSSYLLLAMLPTVVRGQILTLDEPEDTSTSVTSCEKGGDLFLSRLVTQGEVEGLDEIDTGNMEALFQLFSDKREVVTYSIGNDNCFGDDTSFNDTSFGNDTSGNNTSFGNDTSFNDTSFGNDTSVNNTSFSNDTLVNDKRFGNDTLVNDKSFGNDTSVNDTCDDTTESMPVAAWYNLCSVNLSDCVAGLFDSPLGCQCECQEKDNGVYLVTLNCMILDWMEHGFLRFGVEDILSNQTNVPPFFIKEKLFLTVDNEMMEIMLNGSECVVEISDIQDSQIVYCVENLEPPYSMSLLTSNPNNRELVTGNSVKCISTTLRLLKAGSRRSSRGAMIAGDSLILAYKETSRCEREKEHSCLLTNGQEPTVFLHPLELSDTSSICAGGVEETNYFYYNGWVNSDSRSDDLVFLVQMANFEENYNFVDAETIYTINITRDGCKNDKSPNMAYCYLSRSEKHYFRVNMTADLSLNNKTLRVIWPRDDGTFDSSLIQKLPDIYAKNDVRNTLDLDGSKVVLVETPQNWNFLLDRRKASRFEFCVYNLRPDFTISMGVGRIFHKSVTNKICLITIRRPACGDGHLMYYFKYEKTSECKLKKNYYIEVMPELQVNGRFKNIRNPHCLIQWESEQSNSSIQFCLYNLAQPFNLTASINGHTQGTTADRCISLKDVTRKGRLIFRADDGCDVKHVYHCDVNLTSKVEMHLWVLLGSQSTAVCFFWRSPVTSS